MAEQQPADTRTEPDGSADDSVRLDERCMQVARSPQERLHAKAISEGWSNENVGAFLILRNGHVRGAGFPDNVLWRRDPRTGRVEMLAAELKRDKDSSWGKGQKEWLEAFDRMGVLAKTWLGDSEEDIDEMYDILKLGTLGHASTIELPSESAEEGEAEVGEPLTDREWFFQRKLHDEAIHQGWAVFHTEGFRVVRGDGFPDNVMWRRDPETGRVDMFAAKEQSRTDTPFVQSEQGWIDAFDQMGILVKVWRGNSEEDWKDICDILENGIATYTSTTKLPPELLSSPIPSDFRRVMTNTIESIQGSEMQTGEKASLRRMDIANPDGAMFWRLMGQRGMPRNLNMEGIRKWGLIMHGIAVMSHTESRAHNPNWRVGRVLFEVIGGANSDNRLATLLAARGSILHQNLARLFRRLSVATRAFDWHEMAWFILNEGCNEERADEARIQIARAYYRAEYSSSQSNTETE